MRFSKCISQPGHKGKTLKKLLILTPKMNSAWFLLVAHCALVTCGIRYAHLGLVTLPDLQPVLYWPRCGRYYHPHLEQPIRDQYSCHVISIDQSEASIHPHLELPLHRLLYTPFHSARVQTWVT